MRTIGMSGWLHFKDAAALAAAQREEDRTEDKEAAA